MVKRILFVIGTDTGVGKTVFAALLTQRLRERGIAAAALKPLCSGGRGDARILHGAAGKILTLDEVNPWHFRAPLAPLIAARMENNEVNLSEVISHIRAVSKRFERIIVEGAGGLLSPLGEKFDARDCLLALDASPILVCPNRLGAINQILLVIQSLPEKSSRKLQLVLMSPRQTTAVSRSNLKLLEEFLEPKRIHVLPWFRSTKNLILKPAVAKVLDEIAEASAL